MKVLGTEYLLLFIAMADEGNSSYNGLQATVTKKFSHGLYIQGAYTWSHVIDDAALPFNSQAGQTEFPTNSFNLRADRGNGSYDVRHVLVVNYVWELPLGQQKPYLNRGLAVAKENAADARWLSAATLDRYLQSIQQKQIFGTQYEGDDQKGYTNGSYDSSLLTDSVRKALEVPTLEEQKKDLANLNKSVNPPK